LARGGAIAHVHASQVLDFTGVRANHVNHRDEFIRKRTPWCRIKHDLRGSVDVLDG
jgi:hypothetical protein